MANADHSADISANDSTKITNYDMKRANFTLLIILYNECNNCGKKFRSQIPSSLKGKVQYGDCRCSLCSLQIQ